MVRWWARGCGWCLAVDKRGAEQQAVKPTGKQATAGNQTDQVGRYAQRDKNAWSLQCVRHSGCEGSQTNECTADSHRKCLGWINDPMSLEWDSADEWAGARWRRQPGRR